MKLKKELCIKHIYFATIVFVLVLVSCTKEDMFIDDLKDFKLISPTNQSTELLLDIVLEWKELSSGNVVLPYSNLTLILFPLYEVYLSEKVTNELILHTITAENYIEVENLKASTTYQWKVIAVANNEILCESETWEFKTEPKTYRGDVRLSTQNEVDFFGGMDYLRIFGNLEITSSGVDPIVDISSLSGLNSITGDFKFNNTDLTSLAFFINLKSIGRNLEINDNNELTVILSYDSLEYIGGQFSINRNKELVTLNGFTKLKTIGSNLLITENSRLNSISIFNELDSINWGLVIQSNNLLATINGFENLKYIRGDLKIFGNISLTSITGFENLTTIGEKNYHISKNLEIKENDNLSEIPSFNKLKTIGGSLIVSSNDNLTAFTGFDSLISVTEGFIISNNIELTSIPSFNNLETIERDFSIGWNESLVSIEGFENLKTIGFGLYFESNDILKNISGLNQLESINNNFIIDNNYKLTTIEAFEKLNRVGYNIWVYNNYELSLFCFLKPLIITGNFQSYNVFSNKVNPTIEEIEAMVCN